MRVVIAIHGSSLVAVQPGAVAAERDEVRKWAARRSLTVAAHMMAGIALHGAQL
jgi:hypothetical protein